MFRPTTAYAFRLSLVGSEMCLRDSLRNLRCHFPLSAATFPRQLPPPSDPPRTLRQCPPRFLWSVAAGVGRTGGSYKMYELPVLQKTLAAEKVGGGDAAERQTDRRTDGRTDRQRQTERQTDRQTNITADWRRTGGGLAAHPCIRASVYPCIRASVHPCIRASVPAAAGGCAPGAGGKNG